MEPMKEDEWTISGKQLLDMLIRVENGTDPELVYAEEWVRITNQRKCVDCGALVDPEEVPYDNPGVLYCCIQCGSMDMELP